MPLRAHLRVDEEPVVDPEPLGQRVMIRCNAPGEEQESRVAIRLREITEHLVECAVLLDHVDHVLERRVVGPRGARLVPPVCVGHPRGQRVERRLSERRRQHGDRAVQLSQGIQRVALHQRSVRLPAGRVGACTASLPIYDPERVAHRKHGCRVPLGGNATRQPIVASGQRHARRRGAQVEHRDGIGVRFRYEQPGPVPRKRERVRRAALERAGRGWIRQLRDDARSAGVDHRDPIGARRGCEEPAAVGAQAERRRMTPHLDDPLGSKPPGHRAEHGDRRPAPGRDMDPPVRRHGHVVGIRRHPDPLSDPAGYKVHDRDRVAEVLRDVEGAAVRGEPEPRRIPSHRGVGRVRFQHDAVRQGRGRGLAGAPGVDVDGVGRATRRVERGAVRRPGEAKKGTGLRQPLDDDAPGAVDDLEPLLAPPAHAEYEISAIRRGPGRQGHVAHSDRAAGRVESRAGRQPVAGRRLGGKAEIPGRVALTGEHDEPDGERSACPEGPARLGLLLHQIARFKFMRSSARRSPPASPTASALAQ